MFDHIDNEVINHIVFFYSLIFQMYLHIWNPISNNTCDEDTIEPVRFQDQMVGSSDSQSESCQVPSSSFYYICFVSFEMVCFHHRGIFFEEIPKPTRIIIRVVYRADKNETYIHPLSDLWEKRDRSGSAHLDDDDDSHFLHAASALVLSPSARWSDRLSG